MPSPDRYSRRSHLTFVAPAVSNTMSVAPGTGTTTSGRTVLRIASGLAVAGAVAIIVASRLHGGTDPAELQTVLPQYAANPHWKTAHLGQFVGFLFALSSLIILLNYLSNMSGSVVALLGIVSAGTTTAVFAVNQAVDGVAIRYVAENWVNAAPEGRAGAMVLAQAVRHIEQGASALVAFNLGVTLLLCGTAMFTTRVLSKGLGAAALVVGVAYIATGVTLYYVGFAAHVLTFWSSALLLIWLASVAYALWQEGGR